MLAKNSSVNLLWSAWYRHTRTQYRFHLCSARTGRSTLSQYRSLQGTLRYAGTGHRVGGSTPVYRTSRRGVHTCVAELWIL
eukprot:3846265-Rhodomonas_salina.3